MFLFPVLYISNTFLSILADPSSADFWIKVTDASTPISFKLPFYRNGNVPKAPNTIGHVRYINIQAWLRGFRVKIANFLSFFCLSIPKRDLETKKTTPNTDV